MRQLIKKAFYETPLTTKRVVTMEGSCMAASNEKVVNELGDTKADINRQNGWENTDFGTIDASDQPWNTRNN